MALIVLRGIAPSGRPIERIAALTALRRSVDLLRRSAEAIVLRRSAEAIVPKIARFRGLRLQRLAVLVQILADMLPRRAAKRVSSYAGPTADTAIVGSM